MMAVGLLSLLFAGKEAKGQDGHYSSVLWNAGIVFESDNAIYAESSRLLSYLTADLKGLTIQPRWRYNNPDITINGVKLETSPSKFIPRFFGLHDWGFKDFAIGYQAGFIPKRGFPLGLEAGVMYDQVGCRVRSISDNSLEWLIKKQVSPSVLLRIRVGSWMKMVRWRYELLAGVKYDQVLNYQNNTINDKNAVNGGLSLVFGLNNPQFGGDKKISNGFRIELPTYEYYNKDFVHNGSKIFENSSSKMTKIIWTTTIHF